MLALVLEDDVVSDFYDPLLRLFFLTYPQRGDEMSKSYYGECFEVCV